jgi:hypothetical protein
VLLKAALAAAAVADQAELLEKQVELTQAVAVAVVTTVVLT